MKLKGLNHALCDLSGSNGLSDLSTSFIIYFQVVVQFLYYFFISSFQPPCTSLCRVLCMNILMHTIKGQFKSLHYIYRLQL